MLIFVPVLLMDTVSAVAEENEQKQKEENKESPLEISGLVLKEGCFEIDIENKSEKDLVLIDQFDSSYSVVSVNITKDGVAVKTQYEGVDWGVFKKDLITLAPKAKLKRKVKVPGLELDPGKYKIEIKYEVSKDSFFIEPWLKGMHSDKKGERYAEELETIKKVWIGKAQSKPFSINIENKIKWKLMESAPAK